MLDKTSLSRIRSVLYVLYVLKPAKRADFSMIGRFVNFLMLVDKLHKTLNSPDLRSAFANGALYPFAVNLVQVAQAHNVSPGDDKSIVYRVPSEMVEFDTSLMWPGSPPGTLRPFAFDAITGQHRRHGGYEGRVRCYRQYYYPEQFHRRVSELSHDSDRTPLRLRLVLGRGRNSLNYRVSTALLTPARG